MNNKAAAEEKEIEGQRERGLAEKGKYKENEKYNYKNFVFGLGFRCLAEAPKGTEREFYSGSVLNLLLSLTSLTTWHLRDAAWERLKVILSEDIQLRNLIMCGPSKGHRITFCSEGNNRLPIYLHYSADASYRRCGCRAVDRVGATVTTERAAVCSSVSVNETFLLVTEKCTPSDITL
jgi:hypothetical protein